MTWLRFPMIGAAALVGSVTLAAVSFTPACDSGAECTCEIVGVSVQSPAGDLVSLSGCGDATDCQTQAHTSTCAMLSLGQPKITGGDCDVTITFADASQMTVVAHFGVLHHSTDCCGDWFDNGFSRFIVHAADASIDAPGD